MKKDVSDKVKKMVSDHLGVDEAKVIDEANFIDDLGADSLDTVELVMAFEDLVLKFLIVKQKKF